jgi:acyl dehydratase
MSNKFIGISGTVRALFTAIVSSAGVADANKIVQTDGSGKLDATLMPAGIGAATESMVAFEALAAGDFVNIYLNTGVRNARKADASNGRVAHGFVTASVASSASATVILQGTNTALTGLTIGSRYFLSPSAAGTATLTSPTASGHTIQVLGTAVTATSINFEYDDGIAIQ